MNTLMRKSGFSAVVLLAMVVSLCGLASAQTLIGSPGAGWQTWSASNVNDNSAPWWDTQWGASQPNDEGSNAEKNVGYCMTSTGDCIGIGSAQASPGALEFWGMPYNSQADSGGARDNKVYFRNNGGSLRATLMLNSSSNPNEINEIGWFETNSTGSVIGAKHILFEGTGPNENLIPAPVGATVTFTPTAYFGYYYADVSEGNCYAYTLYAFNDPNCTGTNFDHDFVVFSANPGARFGTYWIAGEDPADCPNNDGDCNLTLIRVRSTL